MKAKIREGGGTRNNKKKNQKMRDKRIAMPASCPLPPLHGPSVFSSTLVTFLLPLTLFLNMLLLFAFPPFILCHLLPSFLISLFPPFLIFLSIQFPRFSFIYFLLISFPYFLLLS